MPHALTLRLDEDAAARVARLWRAIKAQTGDDDALRLGYGPHITLAVLPDGIDAAAVAEAGFAAARGWDALPVTLAGLGVFPGGPAVVWAAPVVTGALLARHAALHAALAPFPAHAHYRPGAWVPHVTLSKDGHAPAAHIIEAATGAWDGPITGRLNRLELVRFRPVEILRSTALQAAGASTT